MMVGGADAREVAFCDPGFDIKEISRDRAVCKKSEQVWVDKGPRNCAFGGHRVSDEFQPNGGDKCTGDGSLVSGPAIECAIDPAYGPGHRTNNVRGARDRCEKQETRRTSGNIKTRNEELRTLQPQRRLL